MGLGLICTNCGNFLLFSKIITGKRLHQFKCPSYHVPLVLRLIRHYILKLIVDCLIYRGTGTVVGVLSKVMNLDQFFKIVLKLMERLHQIHPFRQR